MSRIDGKTALVTGAASGIGASIASVLAQAGADVFVTDVRQDEGRTVTAAIKALGHSANFLQLDVASEQDWEQAMSRVRAAHGGLDVLVNNAGVALVKPLEETTLEEFRRVTSVNVDGMFLGVKYALPLMKERAALRPAGGSIINLSSVAGNVGLICGAAYGMSKGAVRNLTKCIALECAHLGYNIRVNSVHPGIIDTPMVEAAANALTDTGVMGTDTVDETLAALRALYPLKRFGSAEEVAKAVLFLASDDSSFSTGSELIVDGGALAQ